MCSDESTNVADYALNQASLESVFMKVVKNSGENWFFHFIFTSHQNSFYIFTSGQFIIR